MKTKNLIFLGVMLLLTSFSFGQISQTIRGTVVDKESQYPLIGVNVSLTSITDGHMGASTDLDGTFRIDGVPVGRHDLVISYLGYGDEVMNNIIVSSAKEIILDIKMEEGFTELEEVTIVAKRNGEVMNEVATVSAREFSVQETNRYAGSRGEPARMASNFAGVQGADDSRNDIVVRGNSPAGVLWRLEGVNIPNPNHFAVPGTGGGPVTILNNKFLANSDFFTGAFPAEYGNSIAGVFDLKMRNGNNEKHEFSGQLGFLGTELMAEGPINKDKRSSYLVMYRYATLKLFEFMNIKLGTDAVPKYQDAAFRLNFPMKNGANVALFGIGGMSKINILLSETDENNRLLSTLGETDLYAASSRDQIFGSRMGVFGLSYTKPINKSLFMKATVSASHSKVDGYHELIEKEAPPGFEEDESAYDYLKQLTPMLDYVHEENKYSAYLFFNKKVNRKLSVKTGVNFDLNQISYIDSARAFGAEMSYPIDVDLEDWRVRWDAKDMYSMLQPYAQFKYKASEKFTLTGGLNSLYCSINKNSFSPVEPRLGMSYQLDEKQKLSLGLGLHSQMFSPYVYYYSNNTIDRDPQEYNKGIGFTKSMHAVLSYDRMIGNYFRLKAETYYQYLYDIPVEFEKTSYSLINNATGFGFLHPDPLQNGGIGQNYGVELTLEKFFHKGYYFLVTGSLFDAKYKGNDDTWRNTTFNGKYALNALFAKEFTINKKSALNFGGKVTYAGGRWYGEVDHEESRRTLDVVYIDSTVNTLQHRPYFRMDLKINYRINTKKFTHEIAIDFVNVLNTKNILGENYEPGAKNGPVVEQHQLGFLPLFYYKLDF